MLSYPLTRVHRLRLAKAFATVPRVDISIEAVLDEQMGKAFVDSLDNPQFFMIEQDSFFCYFAGDFSGEAGRDFLTKTPSGRMVMAGSEGWRVCLEAVFGERLKPIPRYNHASNTLLLDRIKPLIDKNPYLDRVKRIDAEIAQIEWQYFGIGAFESAEDFVTRGIGYSLLEDGKIMGAAYSSLVSNTGIEMSVVIDPVYRRQGVATLLCALVIEWCIENHVSPHWDAANEASCNLAKKLGYRKLEDYSAYYLQPEK